MTEGIARIKTEPVDQSELEARIIELCEKRSTAINNQLLDSEIPIGDKNQKVAALNSLLSQGKLEVLKQGRQFVYRLKDPETAGKCRGADTEDKLIYQIIEDAGNKGIWSRDIRFKSNLVLTQLNKILKSLESKKLIKAVKSVAASKKKVYMLYNLEPDRSVTGGAWYSDQDFESEFVEVLNQQCYRFLQLRANKAKEKSFDPLSQRNASYSSSVEIWKYITELQISKVALCIDDIESILNTLIFDGKVEKLVVSASGENVKNMYRAVEPILTSTGLMRMPCGVCQVFNDCHEGGIISPSTCQYMKEWLDF